MAVDLTNSLEYKRIVDTYKSVLFVDSTNTSHVSCYTGNGYILPWEFNNGGMQFYGKHITCDSLITNNISSTTTRCTSTIACNTLTINSNNGKIVDEITDDDNCGVTDKYVIGKFADISNTKIDIDILSSDVGVSMINVGTDNNVSSSLNALSWVFDAPNHQKHYYVIIVPLCVYVTNDFTFTLNLNGTPIASTRIKNNTNHGDRLIEGWANSTFIHTLPAGNNILRGKDNELTVTMVNGNTACVKKNILILNGE